jgi:hypothetical protein
MQIGTPAPPPAAPQGREHLPPGVRDHERSDANVRIIGWVMLAMIIGAIVMLAALYAGMKALTYAGPLSKLQPPADVRPAPPPEPRLQIDEEGDLARLRAQEEANLSRYGWVDKQNGVAKIPVARALELVVERGLPKWGDGTPRRPGEVRATNAQEQEAKQSNVK